MKSAPEGWKIIIKWVSKHWTQSLAGLTAAVYILGFLVVNSHLSQYGIYDWEFGNVRYLYGGFIFAIYLTVYYLSCGRLVIDAIEQKKFSVAPYIKNKGGARGSTALSLMRLVHLLFNITFLAYLGSAFFSFIAFSVPTNFLYFGYAVGAFLIAHSFVSKFEHRHPKICAMTSIIIKISAMLAFFYSTSDCKLLGVFMSYLLITALLNFVCKEIEENRAAIVLKRYTGIFAVFILLIFALAFGRILYGKIPRSIGGGQPLYADVQIREEFTSLFPNRENSTSLAGVKIVHITGKYIFIEEGDEIIRIPDHSIVGMKTKKPKNDADKEN